MTDGKKNKVDFEPYKVKKLKFNLQEKSNKRSNFEKGCKKKGLQIEI